MHEIIIVTTFTESPSVNVRITHNGLTIFYNSDRLQGSERVREIGEILDLHELMAGELAMSVTQEQYNAVCGV